MFLCIDCLGSKCVSGHDFFYICEDVFPSLVLYRTMLNSKTKLQ